MLIEISAEETEPVEPVPVFLSFLGRFLDSSVRTSFSLGSLKISFHRLELDGGEDEDAVAVMEARLGKVGSSSDSGTGSACTSSTCTSFAVSGSSLDSGRGLGAGERVGRRIPLEKRSSANERSRMEVGTEREEEGQKENSWEEAELAELRRGEMVISSSGSSFAIVRAFGV